MTEKYYIDSHTHIGSDREFEDYLSLIKGTNIKGVVVFPPVAQIYDRKNMNFQDNDFWRDKRRRANDFVVSLVDKGKQKGIQVFPYFFVWNDFVTDQLDSRFGVKWHRHGNEPFYEYNNPKCASFISDITKRNLPIVLEEEFYNTRVFVEERAPDAKVIIPHLGRLNGGYTNLSKAGIWKRRKVYGDTALAGDDIIREYIQENGIYRILFGSDFPFGDPREELEDVLKIDLGEKDFNELVRERITRENILNLLNRAR